VLIIEVDDVGPESFERTLDTLFMRSGRLSCTCCPFSDFDAELGGDHHLSAHWRQRLAHELFVGVRTVDFGGIENVDTAFNGRPDERVIACLSGRTP